MKVVETSDDLFEAAPGSLLVHACNTKGVWGSGIAKSFRERFPVGYEQYRASCEKHGADLLGRAVIVKDSGYFIGCLMTSVAYGAQVDSPSKILTATVLALMDLMMKAPKELEIYSNRFNSGLFYVPWEQSKALIEKIQDLRTWTVCTPEKFQC